jgi:acyl-CoA dehydrogenase
MSTRADALVVETVERILAATSTFETVEQAECDRWAPSVWDALAGAGFPWVSIPESAGGSGGTLADIAAIIRRAGAHSAPVPIAETALLGGWLLASAGLTLPEGPLTVVPDGHALVVGDGRVRGRATVAWAQQAARIVGLAGDRVVAFRPDQMIIVTGANMAGEPRDTVTIDIAVDEIEHAPAPPGVDRDALLLRGSLSRVLLSAGALGAMSRLTVDYTNTRRQFGKPVATFQAVQQHLVTVAQCAVRAEMAADVAVRALADGTDGIELVAARVVVDEAAVLATRAAHQAHGAMGVTREYPLHHLSRRLWAWRHEYGRGTQWRQDLGRRAHTSGADALFPLITG